MAKTQEEKNKIEFLLNEYSNFWMGMIRTGSLLKALKKLPEDMILEKNQIVPSGPGLPPTMKNKIVKDRIEEVERDNKILTVRLEAVKEELEKIPGGKDALDKWKWDKSQDQ